jgi:hypothetical protein
MGTRSVAIDWEGLERALTRQARESEVYVDTRTGDLVYVTRGWSNDHGFSDPELDEGLASGRLVPVEPLPAEVEHGWMVSFAETLDDGWPRDALQSALRQGGAFRAFEEALGVFPDVRQRWLSFYQARVQSLVRAWLVANDVLPTTEPPRRMAGVLEPPLGVEPLPAEAGPSAREWTEGRDDAAALALSALPDPEEADEGGDPER